ncbi:MAG: prolipoprotein diacylglyceryl transferase family protein [Bacteroidota bacterium]
MYPDLSYLFHDLIGTEPDNWLSIFKTFGFFLLMAFLTAAWLLKIELKRREQLGQFKGVKTIVAPGTAIKPQDYVINGLVGFILGYKLPYAFAHFEEWKQDPGSVLLSTDGNLLLGLLAAALFVGYYYWLAQKEKDQQPKTLDIYPSDRIGPITFVAAIGGLIGAKVFAVIEYLPQFFANPVHTFFSGSGLAIYGGLIGGTISVLWYLRKQDITILPFTDAVAPALIVSYGVGRIGCQLSGDGDWGVAAGPQPDWWFLPDWMWAYNYPNNVIREGIPIDGCELEYCTQLAAAAFPTPFYETVMAFAIGAILWSLRKRLTPIPGLLMALYLIFNGIERFLIEYVRINDQYDVFGLKLTQAQLIAIGFVLVGVWLAWYARKRATAT